MSSCGVRTVVGASRSGTVTAAGRRRLLPATSAILASRLAKRRGCRSGRRLHPWLRRPGIRSRGSSGTNCAARSELVRQVFVELVHEQLNGDRPTSAESAVSGRRQCRQCRRAAERRSRKRRAAAKADREPHPEPKVPSVDRWLVDRGLAEHRDGELVATAEGLELGAVFE
jgi:hypothetical protein